MKNNEKKSFFPVLNKILVSLFVIFMMIFLIGTLFFNWKFDSSRNQFFQKYYEETKDPRYEWAK